jgi:nitric oxide reductase subunit C
MTTKTAKWIFYFGTLSSAALFLILTADMHRQVGALTHADQLSYEVVAGKKIFQKYNCNDCHTILGFGGYYAPDLTRVYSRRGDAYTHRVISEPNVVLANSFRKMPNNHLPQAEIDQLVAFFKWVDGIENNDWPPQDSKKRRSPVNRLVAGATVSRGAALFKENNCFECHQLQGVGGNTGPALDEVGQRMNVDAIGRYIVNPQAANPKSEMPAQTELSSADLNALADFLARQNGGER